jgi:penicillin-binding protein 2
MNRHRVLFIAVLLMLPFLGVETRLFLLQGVQADDYRDQILRRRSGLQLMPLWRGRILERNGGVLANDERGFDLQIRLWDFQKKPGARDLLIRLLPDRRAEIDEKIRAIQARIDEKLIGLSAKEYKRMKPQEYRVAYPFIDDIPFHSALMIESHPDVLPGLDIQEKLRRRYPRGTVAAHVVGTVGKLTKEEYDKLLGTGFFQDELGDTVEESEFDLMKRRGLFLEEMIGRAGIEKVFHRDLRGQRGAILRERDTLSGETSEITAVSGVPGRDVRLTLDLEAQTQAEKALEGKRGAIVALDVESGEVLVMASAPGFNPNDFAPPPNNEAIRKYLAPDAGTPLLNRAVASAYPLGSVFKIVTGSAAMQEQKITPTTTFECTEAIVLGNHPFRCWIFEHGTGHGSQDLPGALQRSCNIFFYNCGGRLGVANLVQWASNFGLGTATGIELPFENRGRIPRMPAPGAKTSLGEAYNLAIGQGELQVSPLQAARIVAVIANGGRLLKPRIVVREGDPPEFTDIPIRKDTLETVRRGMWNVVNEPGGTALRSKMSQFKAAGKTGTAQAGGNKPNHAWFVCYFPFDRPRYAMCVFVEHGGKGSEAAAPLAFKVAESLERMLPAGAKPSETASRPTEAPPARVVEPLDE